MEDWNLGVTLQVIVVSSSELGEQLVNASLPLDLMNYIGFSAVTVRNRDPFNINRNQFLGRLTSFYIADDHRPVSGKLDLDMAHTKIQNQEGGEFVKIYNNTTLDLALCQCKLSQWFICLNKKRQLTFTIYSPE